MQGAKWVARFNSVMFSHRNRSCARLGGTKSGIHSPSRLSEQKREKGQSPKLPSHFLFIRSRTPRFELPVTNRAAEGPVEYQTQETNYGAGSGYFFAVLGF